MPGLVPGIHVLHRAGREGVSGRHCEAKGRELYSAVIARSVSDEDSMGVDSGQV